MSASKDVEILHHASLDAFVNAVLAEVHVANAAIYVFVAWENFGSTGGGAEDCKIRLDDATVWRIITANNTQICPYDSIDSIFDFVECLFLQRHSSRLIISFFDLFTGELLCSHHHLIYLLSKLTRKEIATTYVNYKFEPITGEEKLAGPTLLASKWLHPDQTYRGIE